MEKKLAEYKCDTNEAICLKLGMYDHHTHKQSGIIFSLQLIVTHLLFISVRFPEDVEDDGTTFHPEYSHQIFGDE